MTRRFVGDALRLGSTGRLASEEVVGGRLCSAGLPRALTAAAGALAQPLLLLLKTMQKVDDDVADTGEEAIETLLAGFLTKGFLKDGAQKVGDRAKVLGVDTDAVEGATGDVELIAQTHIDVRDLALAGSVAGPLCQGLEQLLGRDEQVCNALLDGRQLLRLRRLADRRAGGRRSRARARAAPKTRVLAGHGV